MNQPAVDALPDGTSAASEPTVDAAESFLADFDSRVLGREGTPSDATERSSEPESDAAEGEPTADVPATETTESSDPETPEQEAAEDIPQYEPLKYTVNGQEKVADWALKVGDDGVVIPQQHIERFKDLIQRDEWQNTQNRELYAKTQLFEAVTHKVGDTEYKGMDAIRQLQADRAALDASGGEMLKLFADPQFITDLALAYQDGNQQTVQNVVAKALQQVKFAGERAQFDTLQSLTKREHETQSQQTMTQTQDVEFRNIVAEFGRALPDLTPDDLRAMYDHFGAFRDRIFRPATLQEAQALGVRPGTIIKDPTVMHSWAKDRAALRKQYTEATNAAQQAARENAARQSAPRPTQRGKGQPGRTAKPAAPPPKGGEALFEGDDGSFAAWKRRLEAGRWAHEAVSDT